MSQHYPRVPRPPALVAALTLPLALLLIGSAALPTASAQSIDERITLEDGKVPANLQGDGDYDVVSSPTLASSSRALRHYISNSDERAEVVALENGTYRDGDDVWMVFSYYFPDGWHTPGSKVYTILNQLVPYSGASSDQQNCKSFFECNRVSNGCTKGAPASELTIDPSASTFTYNAKYYVGERNGQFRFACEDIEFPAGRNQWHTIVIHAKLSSSSDDGLLEVWHNGDRKYSKRRALLPSGKSIGRYKYGPYVGDPGHGTRELYTDDFFAGEGYPNYESFLNATSYKDRNPGEGGGGDGDEPTPPSNDDVSGLDAPGTVTAGSEVTISVDYAASQSRDVTAVFQLGSNPWDVYDAETKAVDAGEGTVSFTLSIPGDLAVANDRYQFQTFITPTGQGWNERLDNQPRTGVSVVAGGGGNEPCVNFALDGSATASGAQGSNPASNTVDGVSDTDDNRWAVQGYPQTLTIDLGTSRTIDEVIVVPFRDRDYEYTVEIAGSQQNYAQVADERSSADRVARFPPVLARYVRLTITGCQGGNCSNSGWVALREVEVYGCGGAGTSARSSGGGAAFATADRLYPNPTTDGRFTLELARAGAVEILDATGRALMRAEFDAGARDVDLSAEPPGVYLVRTPSGTLRVVR